MRSAQFVVRLPEPLADAVLGEAVRRSMRTSDVIAEILREALPQVVARRLEADLSMSEDARSQGADG